MFSDSIIQNKVRRIRLCLKGVFKKLNKCFSAREIRPVNSPEDATENPSLVDWDFANEELMAKQGIDLKAEMSKKLKELEEQYLKEKEEANEAFRQERKVSRSSNKDFSFGISFQYSILLLMFRNTKTKLKAFKSKSWSKV